MIDLFKEFFKDLNKVVSNELLTKKNLKLFFKIIQQNLYIFK